MEQVAGKTGRGTTTTIGALLSILQTAPRIIPVFGCRRQGNPAHWTGDGAWILTILDSYDDTAAGIVVKCKVSRARDLCS